MDKHRKAVILVTFLCGLVAATAVNFLGKDAARELSALNLNALRLLAGAIILGGLGLLLKMNLRMTGQHLWRYAVVGPLNMAVPQGLLFMGMRSFGSRPIDAAIVEAAIPGVILVYLFAGRRRLSFSSILAAAIALVGLAWFLGLFGGEQQQGDSMTTGSWLLLASALITGIGLIIDDSMKWPEEPEAEPAWRLTFPKKETVTKSLRKTLFSSLFSGLLTLAIIPLLNPILATQAKETIALPSSAWPGVIALALVGTCITWFCIFLLIQLGQLVLVVALVAGIPVLTAIYNYLAQGRPLTTHELLGGGVLIVALAFLVYRQMVASTTLAGDPTKAQPA